MKLSLEPSRRQSKIGAPLLTNITNRINYLTSKNESVNKKLVTIMNLMQRKTISERSQNSESIEKSSLTFRINSKTKKQKFKKTLVKVSDEQKALKQGEKAFQEEEKTANISPKERVSKKMNEFRIDIALQERFNRDSFNENRRTFNKDKSAMEVQGLKRGKIHLQKGNKQGDSFKENSHERRPKPSTSKVYQPNMEFSTRLSNQQPTSGIHRKTNNFFQQHQQPPTPTPQSTKPPRLITYNNCFMKQNYKRSRQSQKLKLIEIKKKLLQQEEKSLIEYEKCVLYKEKLVDRIRGEGERGEGGGMGRGRENERK